MKNWETVIPEEDVVKSTKLPKPATDHPDLPDGVRMEAVAQSTDRVALEEEKAKLLARIAEIDAMLNV